MLGYDVSVVAGAARADWRDGSNGLHAHLHQFVRVPPLSTNFRDRIVRLARMSRSALRLQPVNPWAFSYQRAGFGQAALDAANELKPQIVLLRSAFSHLGDPLESAGHTVILDAHDADALLARSMAQGTVHCKDPALSALRGDAPGRSRNERRQ